MKRYLRGFFVVLLSVSFSCCQKNNLMPKALENHSPTLSVASSLTMEDKCMTLGRISLGEKTMSDYAPARRDDPAEDVVEIQFTWSDGQRNSDTDCFFKPK